MLMRPPTGRLPPTPPVRTMSGMCTSAVAMSAAAFGAIAAMSGVCVADSRLFGHLGDFACRGFSKK